MQDPESLNRLSIDQPISQPTNVPNVVPFDVFVEKCRSLSCAEFLEQFQHPFLLEVSSETAEEKRGGFTTVMLPETLNDETTRLETVSRRVFALEKRGVNHFSWMITIGRTNNNDLVLESSTVSKYHASFEKEGSEWLIRDSASRNGTFISGKRLPPHKGCPVTDGDYVSFGHKLGFLFIAPESMYHYCREF